jgi:ankyrin repeat protein
VIREVHPLELLLDRSVNRPTVDFEASLGHTALSWAAFHGRLVSIQILVERGAEVNRCA